MDRRKFLKFLSIPVLIAGMTGLNLIKPKSKTTRVRITSYDQQGQPERLHEYVVDGRTTELSKNDFVDKLYSLDKIRRTK